MARIGIFGGTFDPIHYAHLFLGELSADEMNLDTVIFVPNGTPPHKDNTSTPGNVRLEMIKLAIEDNPRFAVSDCEINRPGYCYTIDTMRYMKDNYVNDTLFFIMGEDSLDYIEQWKDAALLFTMCEFIVIGRGGFTSDIEGKIKRLNQEYGFVCHYLKSPETDISSADIRNRLTQNKSINYLLPNELIKYIEKNNIYALHRE